jgi:tRNA-dihydrouridine synthase
MKDSKRKLSVAPMMDWTEEVVFTEGEGPGL